MFCSSFQSYSSPLEHFQILSLSLCCRIQCAKLDTVFQLCVHQHKTGIMTSCPLPVTLQLIHPRLRFTLLTAASHCWLLLFGHNSLELTLLPFQPHHCLSSYSPFCIWAFIFLLLYVALCTCLHQISDHIFNLSKKFNSNSGCSLKCLKTPSSHSMLDAISKFYKHSFSSIF